MARTKEEVVEAVTYPAFRISVIRIQKSQIALELPQHNANMSQLIEEGNYEVVTASVQDSASELQIIVVLQKRVS